MKSKTNRLNPIMDNNYAKIIDTSKIIDNNYTMNKPYTICTGIFTSNSIEMGLYTIKEE